MVSLGNPCVYFSVSWQNGCSAKSLFRWVRVLWLLVSSLVHFYSKDRMCHSHLQVSNGGVDANFCTLIIKTRSELDNRLRTGCLSICTIISGICRLHTYSVMYSMWAPSLTDPSAKFRLHRFQSRQVATQFALHDSLSCDQESCGCLQFKWNDWLAAGGHAPHSPLRRGTCDSSGVPTTFWV